MRILEQTSTKLTVQHKSSHVWLIIGYFIIYGIVSIALAIVASPGQILISFGVVGLLCLIMAFFLLASNILVLTSTFDKNLSKITVREQKLFNTNIREHSLSEISDVRIEPSYGLNYKIIVVLRSGKRLTLSFSTKERSLEEKIVQIQAFLDYY
jgi:hypothetical protein